MSYATTTGTPGITVEIQEAGSTHIDVRELTEFLYLFRAGYVAAVQFGRSELEHSIAMGAYDMSAVLRNLQARLPELDARELADCDLPPSMELGISRISYESPLTILFGGLAVALVAAVIFSGGQVDMKFAMAELHVKLPPLGESIAKLRAALKPVN